MIALLCLVLALFSALPAEFAAPAACVLTSMYTAYRAERPEGYRLLPEVAR